MPWQAHNPDRDFSADAVTSSDAHAVHGESEWDRIFEDPVIRERIAQLISHAMRKSVGPGQ
jgi:hypothetical protein